MKVGIITFHRALNYGALLQAFALRYSLTKLGVDAQVLDYRNSVIEEMYYYPSLQQRTTFRDKVKCLIQGKSELKRRFKFDVYRKNYLNLSEKIETCSDLEKVSVIYDRFITGSDQVWNYGAHNFDENYFLGFVKDKRKKYSYAASFGVSCLTTNYLEKYRDLLSGFAMCSVREQQGIALLEQMGIERKRVDIDPSMLLSKEEWQSQFGISITKKQKYIFAYYFELTDTLREYIERLAKKTKCKVLYIGNPLKKPFNCRCTALKTADPIEFVNAIANAEYVVTNSFHGTAFSIIFNKNFYVELLKTDSKVNSRIENVLQTFSLQSRLIDSLNKTNEIDWEKINCKMIELRKKSFDYLKEIVN